MSYPKLNNLCDLVCYISKQANKQQFLLQEQENGWDSISSHEFTLQIAKLATAYQKLGIKKNTNVALLAPSSAKWLICELALQVIGAVSVPMFVNVSKENLKFQLEDAKIKFVILAGKEEWKAVKKFEFKAVIHHDSQLKIPNGYSLNSLLETYQPADLNLLSKKIKKNDLATIIYTSGTTGNPKGVALSQENITTQLASINQSFKIKRSDVTLSFLPLAHIFERMVMYFYLSKLIKIHFVSDVNNILKIAMEVNPTIFTTVPRVLEKIYHKIKAAIPEQKLPKKILLGKAVNYAESLSYPPNQNKWSYKIYQKLIYQKIVNRFGNNIQMIICGGAALDNKINKFFSNIGLPIYQGYGLTETAAVISVNTKKAKSIYSVGKKFPGVEFKIADDGEILAKGKNIMQGYYNNPTATKETMSGVWFKTGDLGTVDKEGYLFITGRKKELCKTSTGKYVPLVMLERKLNQHALIDSSMVVAENKKFTSAIIFLNSESNVKSPQKIIREHIKAINLHLNDWEKIKKFHLTDQLPTIENNQLTPSLKLRRHVILKNYKKEIDKIYNS